MCNADDLVLIIVFLLGGIGRGVVDLVERVVAGLCPVAVESGLAKQALTEVGVSPGTSP